MITIIAFEWIILFNTRKSQFSVETTRRRGDETLSCSGLFFFFSDFKLFLSLFQNERRIHRKSSFWKQFYAQSADEGVDRGDLESFYQLKLEICNFLLIESKLLNLPKILTTCKSHDRPLTILLTRIINTFSNSSFVWVFKSTVWTWAQERKIKKRNQFVDTFNRNAINFQWILPFAPSLRLSQAVKILCDRPLILTPPAHLVHTKNDILSNEATFTRLFFFSLPFFIAPKLIFVYL